jgi:hypothetical protein
VGHRHHPLADELGEEWLEGSTASEAGRKGQEGRGLLVEVLGEMVDDGSGCAQCRKDIDKAEELGPKGGVSGGAEQELLLEAARREGKAVRLLSGTSKLVCQLLDRAHRKKACHRRLILRCPPQ